jgi:hypothetical protein
VVPQGRPLCFKLIGFGSPFDSAEKAGECRPSPRNAGGVTEIILNIGVLGHKLIEQRLVCYEGGLLVRVNQFQLGRLSFPELQLESSGSL